MHEKKFMKQIVMLLALVTLAGCATSKQVHTPSGELGHSINCSGSALNWGMCYEKAGQLCGAKGYTVLSQTGDQGNTLVTANQYGLYATPVVNRSMIVQCGMDTSQ